MTTSIVSVDATTSKLQVGGVDAFQFKPNGVMESIASINGGQLAGLRNRIINGGCQVAQRAAPTLTAAVQYGACDRHIGFISGGTGISGTISQNPNSLFSSGYAFWLASATYTSGSWAYQQRIEANNCQDLSGKTITVSFKVAHDFGLSRPVSVTIAKANAKDNFGTVTTIGSVYTSAAIPSAIGAPTTVTCSFTLGSTDGANGILLQIYDATATTVSAKNVLIGDIQLEVGSTATTFEQRPYGMELTLCQRYYYRIKPGVNASAAWGAGFADSATSGLILTTFPVTMRIAPVSIEQSGVATDYALRLTASGIIACSAVPTFGQATTTTSIAGFTVAAGLTGGGGLFGRTGAATGTNAYLGWSAEL